MIGAIIGDIAGSVYEFNNVKTENFPLIAKQSSYTDDTICTIAIADATMNGWSYKDALLDWCSNYPHPMGGYGASFAQWLNDRDHLPYFSYGNGSAMRASSIGWLFDTPIEVKYNAQLSAEVTHDHPEGIKGAEVTALGVFFLRKYGNKMKFRTLIEAQYGKLPRYIPFSNPFEETCMNAVPVAASCFIASSDFEDAIRKAVAVGGDSDTIAAICGGFAEAYYGAPAELRKAAIKKLPADMRAVVRQFEERIRGER